MNELTERVAAALLADYDRQYQSDHLSTADFKEAAERVLGVVADLLDERAALLPSPIDEPFALGFVSAWDVVAEAAGREVPDRDMYVS